MTMNSTHTRTREEYIEEGKRIARLLQSWIALIEGGNRDLLPELATKLRVLLFEKRKQRSLLFALRDEYKIKIFVYTQVNRRSATIEVPAEKFSLVHRACSLNWTNRFGDDELVELTPELLGKEEAMFNNESQSLREAIKSVANKFGGAHFNGTLRKIEKDLKSENVRLNDLSACDFTIVNTARSALTLLLDIISFCESGTESAFVVADRQSSQFDRF